MRESRPDVVRSRLVGWRCAWPVAVAASIVASACGGLLAPVDDMSDAAADGGGAGDGSNDADTSTPDAFVQPCILDASDDTALCTPPPDDVIFASPGVITVTAGGYGLATFVAVGPWASDPMTYMHYEGSTLPIENHPYVVSYGTPQTVVFLVARYAAGQQGTITVSGHEGNIEQRAEVVVNVTDCAPFTPAMVCAGAACGFASDNCGGLLSCGACSYPTPFCYLGGCIANMPIACPPNQGFNAVGGGCTPCELSPACERCGDRGSCVSADSQCICFTVPP